MSKETSANIDLKALIIPETDEMTATVSYRDGIKFTIRYLSRNSLVKLSRACLMWEFDAKSKQRVQKLDDDRFARMFCTRTVKDWSGVTPRTLGKIMPIDTSKIDKTKLDVPIPYSVDNMMVIIQQAYELDNFLQDAACDIKVFRPDLETEMGNSESSPSGT